jgi:hypothetical protein
MKTAKETKMKTATEAPGMNSLIERAQLRVNVLLILILILLFVGISIGSSQVTNRVTVLWDPNPEPDITGYFVRYGVEGSGITNVSLAGLSTSNKIDALAWASRYWFTVTASNVFLESDPSTVLFYDVMPEPVAPAAPKTITIEIRLLSASGVHGPFQNVATYQFTRTNEFFLADVASITVSTSSFVAIVPPPLPE